MNRRKFMGAALAGTGLAAAEGLMANSNLPATEVGSVRLPREVWIAAMSQQGMSAETTDQMVDMLLAEAEAVAPYKPDFVCFPETFLIGGVPGRNRPSFGDLAEPLTGPTVRKCAAFARRHRCYTICPMFLREGGKAYNAAVVIDRKGEVVGRYRKHHLTEGELENGLAPGEAIPPVFDTDRGKIGCLICFDILWDSPWQALEDQGAEMVFWPSAFPGGRMINAMAWRHYYVVITSTRKGTSKICDIDGSETAVTGHWSRRFAVGSVNLEKAITHTWPYVRQYPAIREKYGRDLVIKIHHEEEWTIFESRNPEVKVADVLKEFDIPTHKEFTDHALGRLREAGWSPD